VGTVKNTNTTDIAFVEAARRGDKEAYAVLVDRYHSMLHALCQRALRDPTLAEDASQEAVLRAFLSLERPRQSERFGPWLCGIGLNICRELVRERSTSPWSWEGLAGGREVIEPTNWRIDPELHAEVREMTTRVGRAVDGHPPGQRAATLLFYLQGFSYAEAASTLGIEISAVKTRLHKARLSLREQLNDVRKENTMAIETSDQLIEMRVIDVRRPQPDGDEATQYLVVLETADGTRRLPIWVQRAEAEALALQLTQTQTPRPLTYSFFADILKELGHPLREVHINRLADEVFYATAFVEGSHGIERIDARPSDALNLAAATGVPIRVEASVLKLAGSADVDTKVAHEGTADATKLASERASEWERGRSGTATRQT
jgi:RNA polymerase sigma factor (sigma-70 family)